MSKIFRVNWVDIKSALVSGLFMAILVTGIEVITIGNIYILDWKMLLNTAIMAFLAIFVSFIKSLFTTSEGTLAGIKIK